MNEAWLLFAYILGYNLPCLESFQKLDPSRTCAFLFIYLNYELVFWGKKRKKKKNLAFPPKNKTQLKLFFICIQTKYINSSCKSHPSQYYFSWIGLNFRILLTKSFSFLFFFPLKMIFQVKKSLKIQ
jgi:hypothetical protein